MTEQQVESLLNHWENKKRNCRAYMGHVLEQAGILDAVEWKGNPETDTSALVAYQGILLWLWIKTPTPYNWDGTYGVMLYVMRQGSNPFIIPLAFQEWIENGEYRLIVHCLDKPRHFMEKPLLFVLPPPDLSQRLALAIDSVMHPA